MYKFKKRIIKNFLADCIQRAGQNLLTFQSSVVKHVTLLSLAAQQASPKQSIIKRDRAKVYKISSKGMEHFVYFISSGIPP